MCPMAQKRDAFASVTTLVLFATMSIVLTYLVQEVVTSRQTPLLLTGKTRIAFLVICSRTLRTLLKWQMLLVHFGVVSLQEK